MFCRSVVSPSTYVMAATLTSFLLLVLATFGRHVSMATSPRLRCPLTCHCDGNYTRTVVSCTSSYLTDIPQLPVGARKILIGGNNITRISADSFPGLHKLTIMRIYRNNIRSIDERAFGGLASLESLYLFEELLSSLESGVFRFFTNLIMLSMRLKLVDVPQREICGLKHLRRLKLAMFQFSTAIFHPCFEELTELRLLSLSSIDQSNISRATFHPFRDSVTDLHLIHCGLRRLPVDMFNDLPKLVVLDLSQNVLTSLPSNIFASLTHLTVLSVDSNKLTAISGELLRPLRHLGRLDIGYNSRLNVTLGEEFLNMTRLHHLTLSGIALKSINNYTFRHLRHSPLGQIDMSTCSLRTISKGAFRPLRNLTVLHLDFNPLNGSALHDAFYGLQGSPLRELRLSSVNLHDFSPTLFDGLNDSDITTLIMTGSNIQYIKRGVFRNLQKVTYLHLSGNAIRTIEDHSFNDLAMLSHLNFDNNNIDIMPSAKQLGISPELSWLSIKRNSIKQIDRESLLGYNNLTTLYLTGNHIHTITASAFAPTRRLKTLDLSDNQIQSFRPGTFDTLPDLRGLILHRNFIQIGDTSLFLVCRNICFCKQ